MRTLLRFIHDVRLPKCSICDEPVELKSSKTDENGGRPRRLLRPQDAAQGNHAPAKSVLRGWMSGR